MLTDGHPEALALPQDGALRVGIDLRGAGHHDRARPRPAGQRAVAGDGVGLAGQDVDRHLDPIGRAGEDEHVVAVEGTGRRAAPALPALVRPGVDRDAAVLPRLMVAGLLHHFLELLPPDVGMDDHHGVLLVGVEAVDGDVVEILADIHSHHHRPHPHHLLDLGMLLGHPGVHLLDDD